MSIKTEVLFNNTWNVRISDRVKKGLKAIFLKPFISRSRLILKAKMCVMNLCVK